MRDYYLSVLVPLNILNLCCSNHTTHKIGDHYNLRKEDPERLRKIIDMILTAPDNAYNVWNRDVNRACLEDLAQRNKEIREWKKEHPEDDFTEEISVADIARAISTSKYKESFIGSQGDEFHVFDDIWIPQFTEDYVNDKGQTLRLYIKFLTPEPGEKIQIPSMHNNEHEYRVGRKH